MYPQLGPEMKKHNTKILNNEENQEEMASNVGKQILENMWKHFPPGYPLHHTFIRNKVKMS